MPNLSLTLHDGLATIIFDRPDTSANLFDRATLEELASALDEVQSAPSVKGLIFVSAKPTIFIAGADLKQFISLDPEELAALIDLGQETFNRIADLPFPTVAAIHGACVGGGFELALACDWRVASTSSKTKIGLPETQLGILPAWGGSTRLPNHIGLPAALPLILGGKVLAAESAPRKGLVDACVPRENLVAFAESQLQRGKRPPKSRFFLHNRLASTFIASKARKSLLEKTRGHYPGPEAALAVAAAAVHLPRATSLENEREAIIRLVNLPETQKLIGLFFLQEKAKKQNPFPGTDPKTVRQVAVVGAGVMGAGIAYWTSTRKLPVTLLDINHAALAKGLETIRKLYDTAVSRHILTRTEAARGLDRIHPAAGPVPLQRVDLVIEAAVEKLAIKKKIFADLAARSRPDTILATNTSALPVTQLAEATPHPERVLGLHFFNPVHRMPLVEIVRTERSSDKALATTLQFVRALGKTPVIVRDSPGFLVNRILMPYLVEATRLFENGGDPEAIDRAMLDFGMPMGPLRLLDEVGLDVALHVAGTLAEAFPDRMSVPPLVQGLIDQGHLGKKSGSGFYQYKDGKKTDPNPAALALRTGNEPAPSDTQERLAKLMTEEAKRCLEEKIAADADTINLAMILGTGYPPFRGGPLETERK